MNDLKKLIYLVDGSVSYNKIIEGMDNTNSNILSVLRISGQFRNPEDNFESIKKICKMFNFICVSTWSNDYYGNIVDETYVRNKLGIFHNNLSINIETDLDEYDYKILGNIFPDNHSADKKSKKNTLRSFYLRYKCKTMYGVSSGLVLNIRPDVEFCEDFINNIKIFKFDKDILYSCSYNLNTNFQVSDKAVIGHYNVIDDYCEIWNNLNYYIHKLNLLKEKRTSERILGLKYNNLVKYIKIIKNISSSKKK